MKSTRSSFFAKIMLVTLLAAQLFSFGAGAASAEDNGDTSSGETTSESTSVTSSVYAKLDTSPTGVTYSDSHGSGALAWDDDIESWPDVWNSSEAWSQIDFGDGKERVVKQIRYYPRPGWTQRMVNTKFLGSNDGESWDLLYEVTVDNGLQWTTVDLPNENAYRYIRFVSPTYQCLNVAEIELYGHGKMVKFDTSPTEVTYADSNGSGALAWDEDLESWPDVWNASDAWTQVDFGQGREKVVKKIRYYPRPNWTQRMVNTTFLGSNDGENWDLLHMVTTDNGLQWTTVDLPNETAYRYIRFVSPTYQCLNVAEIELYGYASLEEDSEEATASKRESLGRLLSFANNELEKTSAGTEPGQYPLASRDEFVSQITVTQQVYDNEAGNWSKAVKDLVKAGSDFFESAVTSDTVIDAKANKLEYSMYRVELVDLVWQAKAALLIEPEYVSAGSKLALQDQIDHAEAVLDGSYSIPFVRNRAFLKPRPDEDIQRAIKYNSMVSGYDSSQYGLKIALVWYQKQNVMIDLDGKASYILSVAQELLNRATPGEEVGQYPADRIGAVASAISQAQTAIEAGARRPIALALVQLLDAEKELRESVVLRSSVEPLSNMYFTAEEIESLKDKVESIPALQEQFDTVKQYSDDMTLEEIEDLDQLLVENPDYEALNQNYWMWSGISNQNFTAPAGAVSASLRVTLPAASNESDGPLGHVWFDNVKIVPSSTAGTVDISNASFESGTTTPDNWEGVAEQGSPVMSWESRTNYASDGQKSVYIENPTASDQGSWVYNQPIAITGGADYTLSYSVKLDGVVASGVQVILTFKDANDSVISEYTSQTDRKSSLILNFGLTMQTDAIVYAVTGDISYAEKAKYRILWTLNDFLQGTETWYAYNQRPYGIDAYGAVQGGRIAASVASAYTLIKDAGVFSAEEYQTLIDRLEYMLPYLSDLRDRSEMSLYDAQANTSNWQTDMSAGSSMLAMAFPELPHAITWLNNGKQLLAGQLEYMLNDSGSWPESIRYMISAEQRFSSYAKALRNSTGEDWFKSTKLGKMFQYNLDVQTPPYEYFDNKIGTPDIGDHFLTGGGDFSYFGIYYNEVAQQNPELGAQMYETWVRAGKPISGFNGEAVALEHFFAPGAFDNPNNVRIDLQSSDTYKDVGLYLFRNNFKRDNESYLAFVANETALGHGHFDQGSFILYANSVPLVMDPSIEGYFDSSKNWYVGSSSHSTVQFKNGTGYSNTPTTSVPGEFSAGPRLDKVSTTVSNGGGAGTQKRTMLYVKNGINAYIVWDQIAGATDGTIFNLPIAAVGTTIEGNKAESVGHYDMDLESTFLLPESAEITQEWGRSTPLTPLVDGAQQLNYVRVKAGTNENFLTVLYPKEKGQEGLQTEQLASASADVDLFRLATEDGKWIVAAANKGASEQAVTVDAGESLINVQSGESYSADNEGIVALSVPAGELLVLKPASLPDGAPASIEINGAASLDLTTVGQVNANYQAAVIDTYNDAISGETVSWSLEGNPTGASISSNGILTVTASQITTSTLVVQATSGDLTESYSVALSLPNSGNPNTGSPPVNNGSSNDTDSSVNVDKGEGVLSISKLPVKDGAARASVSLDEVKQVLASADKRITLKLEYDGDSPEIRLELPAEAGAFVAKAGAGLRVESGMASIQIDSDLLAEWTNDGTGILTLSLRLVDTDTLSLALRGKLGSHPLVEIAALLDGVALPLPKSSKSLIIELPYQASATERAHQLVVYEVEGNQARVIANGMYDSASGIAHVKPGRLGTFGLGYVEVNFADLGHALWAEEGIEALAARGITTGRTAAQFDPSGEVTRAEFAALLTRALGLTATGDASSRFSDVPAGGWADHAIAAAYEAGIVNGREDGTFGTGDSVTREDMALMLHRALGLSDSNASSAFVDEEEISGYARDAVASLQDSGLIQGSPDGTFKPKSHASRAEAALILYRMLKF
ncbi:S-layer homology domain-containing protein [Paenibacillus sp. HB172176]|uniref:S-layer homology domain-containing protein n=1 Tax=Paenibacillus sp. HB172176 TaxID=2493690 RepID=UPI00143B06DD|nr:S-layer homology domain-containing protein [Paenibacillus sp. HB172176]